VNPEHAKRDRVVGRAIPLPGDDIDTDRIIPARYLKCVTFEDLGRYAFYDERFDDSGKPREHPFNDRRYRGHDILLVNRNFGCGSSREHAPQSLMRMGVRAIVGESFAEIFAGNCTALGIPVLRVSHEDVSALMDMVRSDPELQVDIELASQTVKAGGHTVDFQMPKAARTNLMSGTWDTTATLIANEPAIRQTAARLPYVAGY
jgi:3-isopropylmalate/(R)-2-methylmalate dehydratase small subunit